MMNKPSAAEIANGKDLNRYEVVVAVAKGARLATGEYLEVRERAERMINNHETDKSLINLLGPEYKDQKPVKVAIARLMNGEYEIEKIGDAPAIAGEDAEADGAASDVEA